MYLMNKTVDQNILTNVSMLKLLTNAHVCLGRIWVEVLLTYLDQYLTKTEKNGDENVSVSEILSQCQKLVLNIGQLEQILSKYMLKFSFIFIFIFTYLCTNLKQRGLLFEL